MKFAVVLAAIVALVVFFAALNMTRSFLTASVATLLVILGFVIGNGSRVIDTYVNVERLKLDRERADREREKARREREREEEADRIARARPKLQVSFVKPEPAGEGVALGGAYYGDRREYQLEVFVHNLGDRDTEGFTAWVYVPREYEVIALRSGVGQMMDTRSLVSNAGDAQGVTIKWGSNIEPGRWSRVAELHLRSRIDIDRDEADVRDIKWEARAADFQNEPWFSGNERVAFVRSKPWPPAGSPVAN